MVKKIGLLIFISLLSVMLISCETNDELTISYELMNVEEVYYYEGYNKIDEIYYSNNLFVKSKDNEVRYVYFNDAREGSDTEYYFSSEYANRLLHSSGKIKKLVCEKGHFFALSDLGVLVGTDLSGELVNSDSEAIIIWGDVSFNKLIDLDLEETIIDFSVIYNNNSDYVLYVLTSNHRVFSFGNNEDGLLLDGTFLNPINFVEITPNIPLLEDEVITSVGEGYFLTNQNRILVLGLYLNQETNILYDIEAYIELENNEQIIAVHNNLEYNSICFETSLGNYYYAKKTVISIISVYVVEGDNIDIQADTESFTTESNDTEEVEQFINLSSYLNLEDGEEVIEVYVSSTIVFLTSNNRLLYARYNPYGDDIIEITDYHLNLELYENEILKSIIILNEYHSFLLTSYGRIFTQIND